MFSYFVRRVLLTIPTLLLVSIIVFLTIRLIPGDVIDVILSQMQFITERDSQREAIEAILGLDAPIHIQYVRWIGDILLRGSLGDPLIGTRPVAETIMSRLPTTLELSILATIIAGLAAVPIGVYSALRQDTVGDYLARSVSIIFVSVPTFWTATIVILYPSILWGWSPSTELIPFFEDPLGNLGMFLLPAAILGMALSGVTMRMTRTMMLEVLRQDYIRTAWSKGVRERRVVIRHALKNALIPVVTLIGIQFPLIVGGSLIIEELFQLPGIGRLMMDAIGRRDYPVVSGINLIVATVVVLMNVLVDLTYAWIDPRIHYR
ncbi:MAG: ABC transporter permease [Spirochaetaceae bacterium]|nr:ABC transporter permease [Spirochaetaceae bacterium]MDE0449582.1 ABC transporter permease [Spirochaetaceae bacterium]